MKNIQQKVEEKLCEDCLKCIPLKQDCEIHIPQTEELGTMGNIPLGHRHYK
jgi:hypothetical protein